MKNPITTLFLLFAFCSGTLLADTDELSDGTLLDGDFVGSSNAINM